MAGSTPTRDARSSRLGSKPYDRPSSSSSTVNTPNKAGSGGGLLRSLVDKLYSPFAPKNRDNTVATSGEGSGDDTQDDERKQEQHSKPRYDGRNSNSKGWNWELDHKMESEDEDEDQDSRPIKPILQAIESITPITPEQSTHLLAKFMADKQAQGQAGQQTPEEQEAIRELLRRATEDHGRPILGEPASDSAGRPLSISKTGRGLFNSPIREKGLIRSSSSDVLAGSPSKNRLSAKSSFGSPARSWRPLHSSTLAQSQITEKSESTAHQPQSSSFQPQGATMQSLFNPQSVGKPSNMPFASRQPSALSKSTSMFALSSHSGERPLANQAQTSLKQSTLSDSTKTNNIAGQTSSPTVKSAAARTLENLLSKAEAESDKKFNIEPISNPYEGYRFHIGSFPSFLDGSSLLPSSSNRQRASLKPRPRASLGGTKSVPDTTKMSDLDLIQASMEAEQANKRARKASPKPVLKETLPSKPSDQMQVDDSPPSEKIERRSAAPPKPERSSYPILERPQSPAKATASTSFTQQALSTTPKQPPPSKSSAFDFISRTIAATAQTDRSERTSVSFASLPTLGPTKLPEQPEQHTLATPLSKNQTPDELVRKLDVSALPVNTFRSLTGGPDLGQDTSALARQQALMTPKDKLPTFVFTLKMPDTQISNSTLAAAPASTGFTGWGSGIAPQSSKADGKWECPTCMCKSQATSTKCEVCSEPRPATTVESAPKNIGFTGWGTGAQPQSTSTNDWTCNTCMCKSKTTSTKCEVCETPRPDGGSGLPKVAAVAFTGWGAGVQEKAKPASSWTCSTCGLQSKETSSKCDICGADRV